jgi:hypothetical protein
MEQSALSRMEVFNPHLLQMNEGPLSRAKCQVLQSAYREIVLFCHAHLASMERILEAINLLRFQIVEGL